MSSYKDCHNQTVVDNKPKPEPGEMTQKERVLAARKQQFSYGKDMPNYESLSKFAYVKHANSGSNRQEAKEFEKKIRQSHVTMGNDGTLTQVERPMERNPSRMFGTGMP